MNNGPYFTIHNSKFVTKLGQLVEKSCIVLKKANGMIVFTDFHKYATSSRTRMVNLGSNNRNNLLYVVQFLNYAFFYANLRSLNEVTVDLIKEFLNAYGTCTLPDDDETTVRTKRTVEICRNRIMDFFENYIAQHKEDCIMKKEDLYTHEEYRDKHGKVKTRKVPVFVINYIDRNKRIFRDMPNSAFVTLFDHISNNHPELLGLVMVSAFGGARPAEACNVKREGSPDGSGIRFTTFNGEVERIDINLEIERPMRSDLVSVGKIKKERTITIPEIFVPAFLKAYDRYMSYLKTVPYEEEYAPFSVNKQGKAITYASYYDKFRTIVKDELIPIYLASDNPELVRFGHTLLEHNISPHIFRHWFTVQLVLSGVNEAATLASYRGDSSLDSAIVYLKGKGELQKIYKAVNDETFEYMAWGAKKVVEKGKTGWLI